MGSLKGAGAFEGSCACKGPVMGSRENSKDASVAVLECPRHGESNGWQGQSGFYSLCDEKPLAERHKLGRTWSHLHFPGRCSGCCMGNGCGSNSVGRPEGLGEGTVASIRVAAETDSAYI